MERTISGGIHLVYYSRVKPKTVSEYHDSYGLELIAGSKICVMAPSKGYTALNDNPPRIIEDAEGLFYQVLGVPDKRERVNEGAPADLLEKWFRQILDSGKLNIKYKGSNYWLFNCPFHPPDNNPSFAFNVAKWYFIDFHDNAVYSVKQLAEKLGIILEKGREEEEKEEEEGREEEKINLYELAKKILEETPIITDSRTMLMFRWNGKCWVDDAEAVLQSKLVEVEKENYKPYHLTTLTEIVQGLTFRNGFEEPPLNLICFNNGVLDLNSMELKPYSPDYFFRNFIHADYNPDAKCPKFLDWLNEIMPDKDEQALLQEICGYALYRGYPFHYLFFFVGSGRNGKGTLMRTLIAILGKENCVSIPLERLSERFQATNLLGKLANIVSEPKINLITTETIKMLTGEDLITGEFKGKQKTIQFINYAKLIVIANRLPPVADTSRAWWSRVIIVEFPISIPPEKIKPNIEEEWLNNPEERSGIVNWCLEGLKKLLEKKQFTISQTMRKVIEDYKRWSQPIEYFLEKYCEFSPKLWITKKALYEAYKIVCEEEGLPIENEQKFNLIIKAKPRVRGERRRVEGRREYVWVGVSLNTTYYEAFNDEAVPTVPGVPGSIYCEKNSSPSSLPYFVPTVPTFSHLGGSSRGKEEEEKEMENKKFLQYIEPGTPGTLGTEQGNFSHEVGTVWVCRRCAEENGAIMLIENESGSCEVCGANGVPVGRLQISLLKPVEPKFSDGPPYKCPECSASFFHEADLEAHQRGVHGG